MNSTLYTTILLCSVLLLPLTMNGQQNSVKRTLVTNAEPSHAHFLVGNEREINILLYRDETKPLTYYQELQFQPDWKDKQVFIRLSGLKSPFHFWINGFKFGSGNGEGIPVEFNITPFLDQEKNRLKVDLEATDKENSDDALHVSVVVRDAVHVRDFRITDYSRPGSSETLVRVHLFIKSYKTETSRERKVVMTMWDPSGESICNVHRDLNFPLAFRQEVEVIFDQTLKDPMHWSPSHPELYHLQLRLIGKGGTLGEVVSSNFGIRNMVVIDSVLIFSTDTIVPAIAGQPVLNQFTSLTDEEILSLFEEKDYNAIQTNETLPERVMELFDHQGILVLRKQNDRDLSRDRQDMNRPCIVWIE